MASKTAGLRERWRAERPINRALFECAGFIGIAGFTILAFGRGLEAGDTTIPENTCNYLTATDQIDPTYNACLRSNEAIDRQNASEQSPEIELQAAGGELIGLAIVLAGYTAVQRSILSPDELEAVLRGTSESNQKLWREMLGNNGEDTN